MRAAETTGCALMPHFEIRPTGWAQVWNEPIQIVHDDIIAALDNAVRERERTALAARKQEAAARKQEAAAELERARERRRLEGARLKEETLRKIAEREIGSKKIFLQQRQKWLEGR